jgi:hypothetical protein
MSVRPTTQTSTYLRRALPAKSKLARTLPTKSATLHTVPPIHSNVPTPTDAVTLKMPNPIFKPMTMADPNLVCLDPKPVHHAPPAPRSQRSKSNQRGSKPRVRLRPTSQGPKKKKGLQMLKTKKRLKPDAGTKSAQNSCAQSPNATTATTTTQHSDPRS